ncbi:MAG TPA: hypothetical protein VN207_00180 [Ktedonobacteraceae bacterium]|nr:hypothetical protein [Ktedonobacteraceae bacterium]
MMNPDQDLTAISQHGLLPHITVLLATPLFSMIRNFLLLGFLLSTLVSSHFSPNR